MDKTGLAAGKIKAILFFKNKHGVIRMLPSDEDTRRMKEYNRSLGFELYAAETLQEAEALQKSLQEQLRTQQQCELERDEMVTGGRRQQIRARLHAKLASPSVSQFEKDFIRAAFVSMDESHENFKKRFTQTIGHLDQLEFDNPNAHVTHLLDNQ